MVQQWRWTCHTDSTNTSIRVDTSTLKTPENWWPPGFYVGWWQQQQHLPEINDYLVQTEIVIYFNSHQRNLPILANIAADYLNVPASSVPVERLFSVEGRVFRPDRCLLKDWYSSDAIVPELTVYIECIFMEIIIIVMCEFGALDISMTFHLIISK